MVLFTAFAGEHISFIKRNNIYIMNSAIRNNNFNAIRFLAAFFVVAGHMYVLTGESAPVLCGHSIQTIGVYIFFVVGGYFIAQSWLNDKSIIKYTLKRIFRIWPSLIAVVTISIFVLEPCFTKLPLRLYFRHCWIYASNILLYISYSLPGVFENNIYPNAVNGSLWTLPIEVAMYVFVPAYFAIIGSVHSDKLRHGLVLAITVFLCSLDLYFLHAPCSLVIYATDLISAVHMLPFYFIGMTVKYFENSSERFNACVHRTDNLPLAALLLLLSCAFDVNEIYSRIVLYVVVPYMVFAIGYAPSSVLKRIGSKAEITYGIYLCSFPIQQCLSAVLIENNKYYDSTVMVFVSFALSCFAALLLHCTVERVSSYYLHRLLKTATNNT